MRRDKERAERRAMRRGDNIDVLGRSGALYREKPLVTPRGSLYYPRRYQGKGTAAAATMLSGVAGAWTVPHDIRISASDGHDSNFRRIDGDGCAARRVLLHE